MNKKIIGSNVVHQGHCPCSSIDWAKKHFYDVPDGTMFVADSYAMARGRQGRIWKLYPGQLIMTIVLKPAMQAVDEEIFTGRSVDSLTMALTVGIANVLRSYGVGVKWPNDFVFVDDDNHILKVGGILLSAVWRGKVVDGFIVGIGINVMNTFASDDDLFGVATSLKDVAKNNMQRDSSIASKCIASLDTWYGIWRARNFDEIFSHWRSSQCCFGKMISVHYKDGKSVTGCMIDVAPCGSLLLRVQQNDGVGNMQGEEQIPFCCVEDITVVSTSNK